MTHHVKIMELAQPLCHGWAACSTSIYSWDTNASAIKKQATAMLGFNFGYIILYSAACDFASVTAAYHNYRKNQMSFKSDHPLQMTSYGFFKLVAAALQICFRYTACWCVTFKKIQKLFPSQISARCLNSLLRFFENELPPYWNYISGFHSELFIIIGVWSCGNLPNFIRIWRSATELCSYVAGVWIYRRTLEGVCSTTCIIFPKFRYCG